MPNTSSPTPNLVTAAPTADHGAGDVAPGHRAFRSAESETKAQQVRPAGHQMPGAPVQTRRLDPEEHL